MKNYQKMTLAEIVTDDHRAAAVFERYHLDFCCKGKRSVEQACEEKAINPADVLLALEESSVEQAGLTDFSQLSISEIIDQIINKHHAYVRKSAPQLIAYLQKVSSKHGQRHPELILIYEKILAVSEELELHMQKEEEVLFPVMRKLEETSGHESLRESFPAGLIEKAIRVMEDEHERAGDELENIRVISNNYTAPPDACTTYKLSFAALQAFEADLHQHVHLENNILFPRASILSASAPQDGPQTA